MTASEFIGWITASAERHGNVRLFLASLDPERHDAVVSQMARHGVKIASVGGSPVTRPWQNGRAPVAAREAD